MVRICVTMSENDQDNFERGRAEAGMSKSSYIRLLIAEHENRVPAFYKNKELIEEISKLNTTVKELVVSDHVDAKTKMQVLENIKKFGEVLNKIATT